MARFFLHVRNGTGFARDEEGQELPHLEAAVRKAIEGIRGILSEEVRHGSLDLCGRIEIADEHGDLLRSTRFAEALALRLDVEAE
jgi:hypothetical protein